MNCLRPCGHLIPLFHRLVSAIVRYHTLTVFLIALPSRCTTCRLLVLCFSEMMFCASVSFTFLRCLVTPLVAPVFHCKPLEQIITCFVVSFNRSFFSACNPGRNEPHFRNNTFYLALCSLRSAHCIVSSTIMSSMMSVSCACVYFCTYFLIVEEFFC